jgi:hypothetical protein
MNAADKQAFQRWSSSHVLSTATFWWKDRTGSGECRLHARTFNEALEIAKQLGFVEPRWYKPWTWYNGVVTVG